jgi:hypothetical protein
MYSNLFVLYGLVVVALFVVAFTVPRLRWVALTLATLGTVIAIVLGAVWFVLLVMALRGSAHIG